MPSYYDDLGVARTATSEDLRRAYRRAVKDAHPDTGGTAAAFAKVQDAWAVLGHPDRRNAYDTRNPDETRPPSQSAGPPPPNGSPASTSEGHTNPPAPEPAHTVDPEPAGTSAPPIRPLPRRAILQCVLLAGAVSTGALTTWLISDFGRPLAAAAVVYLGVTAAVVTSRIAGKTTWEGTYRRLVRGAWILAGGLAFLALLSWGMHHSPWPTLIWSLCVTAYAACVSALWRLNNPAT